MNIKIRREPRLSREQPMQPQQHPRDYQKIQTLP